MIGAASEEDDDSYRDQSSEKEPEYLPNQE